LRYGLFSRPSFHFSWFSRHLGVQGVRTSTPRPPPNLEGQDISVWPAPRSEPVRHGWPHHQLGTACIARLHKRLQVLKEITESCLALNEHTSNLRHSHDGTLHLGLLRFRLFVIQN
jgi:hypothetical protein